MGIHLDFQTPDAHDGIVNGEKIFDTSPGRGIFVSRSDIELYDKYICYSDTYQVNRDRDRLIDNAHANNDTMRKDKGIYVILVHQKALVIKSLMFDYLKLLQVDMVCF